MFVYTFGIHAGCFGAALSPLRGRVCACQMMRGMSTVPVGQGG
nr:MAG TPA: hypothetical protein [Caudoviricetes sp.]